MPSSDSVAHPSLTCCKTIPKGRWARGHNGPVVEGDLVAGHVDELVGKPVQDVDHDDVDDNVSSSLTQDLLFSGG